MENQYEAKPIGEVEGLGLVYQVYAPLDRQILAFQNVGIKHPFLVTPEETAMIRLAGLSSNYTRNCIAPVGVKGEAPLLYKPSILMNPEMAIIAVKSHLEGKYPALDRAFYEVLKERAKTELGLAPEDRTAQVLQSNEDYDLTPEMDDARFLFGKQTAEYFKRFKHPSIKLYNLPTTETPKDKCSVNYLGFVRPKDGSELSFGKWFLDNDGRAFGVLRKSAEGTSQNSGYSLTNVKTAIVTAIPETLEALGLSGVKDIVAGKLEEDILGILRTQ